MGKGAGAHETKTMTRMAMSNVFVFMFPLVSRLEGKRMYRVYANRNLLCSTQLRLIDDLRKIHIRILPGYL